MKSKLILAGVLSIVLFSQCKKDEPDTTAPEINIASPTNDETFHGGETLSITGTIIDNEALSTASIDIHSAEGHTHRSGTDEHDHVEWEEEKNVTLEGSTVQLNESFSIPDEAEPGEYHVIINALDAAGNAAEFVELEIIISE